MFSRSEEGETTEKGTGTRQTQDKRSAGAVAAVTDCGMAFQSSSRSWQQILHPSIASPISLTYCISGCNRCLLFPLSEPLFSSSFFGLSIAESPPSSDSHLLCLVMEKESPDLRSTLPRDSLDHSLKWAKKSLPSISYDSQCPTAASVINWGLGKWAESWEISPEIDQTAALVV